MLSCVHKSFMNYVLESKVLIINILHMKTKNNSRKVEKRVGKIYPYSVVDVILNVKQNCTERGAYIDLQTKYGITFI